MVCFRCGNDDGLFFSPEPVFATAEKKVQARMK